MSMQMENNRYEQIFQTLFGKSTDIMYCDARKFA